jgi:hypothetical protein
LDAGAAGAAAPLVSMSPVIAVATKPEVSRAAEGIDRLDLTDFRSNLLAMDCSQKIINTEKIDGK